MELELPLVAIAQKYNVNMSTRKSRNNSDKTNEDVNVSCFNTKCLRSIIKPKPKVTFNRSVNSGLVAPEDVTRTTQDKFA